MKFPAAVALLAFGAASLHAKWAQMPKDALIKEADAIVIADYTRFKTVKSIQENYDQIGAFRVVQTLKGKVNGSFSVYGRSILICAPQISFQNIKPGRYLLFITNRYFGWTDCNAFIQPIKDDRVLWFSTEYGIEKTSQSILSVSSDIKKQGEQDAAANP